MRMALLRLPRIDAENLRVTAKAGPRTMLAFKSKPNYEVAGRRSISPPPPPTDKGNIYTVKLRAAVNDAGEADSTEAETIAPTEMDTVTGNGRGNRRPGGAGLHRRLARP